MKRLPLCAILAVLLLATAHGIIDSNQNGVSDLWEETYNSGNLLTNFDPQADPDGDGWTNEVESISGTNPFDSNPPAGFIRPEITHTPAVLGDLDNDGIAEIVTPETITISWPTLVGKQYTLLASPDLTAESWLTVDVPRIGTGNTMGNGIPLTQPDGSTPDKLFWRVKVEDADNDGDNLSNYEENSLGTNPATGDTDGDGVSDWDECIIDFTNPLSATDADSDGIADDFEKHMARQLLAFQPDSVYWGGSAAGYYDALVLGDLDATHDYTNDGMPVGQLAQILVGVAAASPSPAGPQYLVDSQIRENSLSGYHLPATGTSPAFSQGQYRQGSQFPYDNSIVLNDVSQFTPSYLETHIGSVPWEARTFPGLTAWYADAAHYWSEAFSGFMTTYEIASPGINYKGRIRQQKLFLVAKSVNHQPFNEQYLKITSKRPYQTLGIGEILSMESVTIQVPAGRYLSDEMEFSATMTDGQETVVQLLPVKFEIVHTEKERDSDGNELSTAINPGKDTLLRDEIADLRIVASSSGHPDWDLKIDVEDPGSFHENLGTRTNVQMYDFGKTNNGIVTPLTIGSTGATQPGPYFIKILAEESFKIVVNKDGKFKLHLTSGTSSIDVTSQEFTVLKRMRKYGRDNAITTFDFNKYDTHFENAAAYWGDLYQHEIDDAERLKAIGMTESELGRNVQNPVLRPNDIMTIGNPLDFVLDSLHHVSGHQEKEVFPENNSIRDLNYAEASDTPEGTAIHWGACWLYHKAQTISPNPMPPPSYVRGTWKSWDTATSNYNGGGVPNYLDRVNRAFRQGKHPTDNSAIWPQLTNKRARQ